jgi:hypothetical protein
MISPNWDRTFEGSVIGLTPEEPGMPSPLEIGRVIRKDKIKIERIRDLSRRDCPIVFSFLMLHI